jgi:hypothetical protein
VTADTFHALRSQLKDEAFSNMLDMLVTADVSQPLMSALKASNTLLQEEYGH